MNILFLGNKHSVIIDFLLRENTVIVANSEIDIDDLWDIDLIVVFDYPFILSPEVCSFRRIIGIHLGIRSRGSDPIFWSICNGLQCGVTIYELNKYIHKGNIILNKKLGLSLGKTLREEDDCFRSEAEVLFINNWDFIKSGVTSGDALTGTFYNLNSKDYYVDDIPEYKDIKISDLKDRIELRKISTVEGLANFYNPLFWLLDLVCTRENINPIDITSPRTHTSLTMNLYMILGLSNKYFNKRTGLSLRLYTLDHIGSFFSKAHSLTAIAQRKMENWAVIYKDYRINKCYYEIKIKEKYGIIR